jgi:hypothetical protein
MEANVLDCQLAARAQGWAVAEQRQHSAAASTWACVVQYVTGQHMLLQQCDAAVVLLLPQLVHMRVAVHRSSSEAGQGLTEALLV